MGGCVDVVECDFYFEVVYGIGVLFYCLVGLCECYCVIWVGEEY